MILSALEGFKQCLWDVELEDGCHKHDEGYVEREAIACLGAMYRDDLVGI